MLWDSWAVCAHTFHCQLLYVSKYATDMTPSHSEWYLERSHSLRCFPGHWLTFRIPCKTQEHKCPNEMFSIPHSLSGRLHSTCIKSGNSCRSRIWPRQSRRTCPTVPRRHVALTTSALDLESKGISPFTESFYKRLPLPCFFLQGCWEYMKEKCEVKLTFNVNVSCALYVYLWIFQGHRRCFLTCREESNTALCSLWSNFMVYLCHS